MTRSTETSTPFTALYGPTEHGAQRVRYQRTEALLASATTGVERRFFSSPGRIELTGNHTDHNGGQVLAAATTIDTIAVVTPNHDNRIVIHASSGSTIAVELSSTGPRAEDTSPQALVRGIAHSFFGRGYKVGGFTAATDSLVPEGSGVSSSASFSMLVSEILNQLYNQGQLSITERALASQSAEHTHWKKPCGLLDQMACGVGGAVLLDFSREGAPLATPLPFRFESTGYKFVLVGTGGSHGALNEEYASMPNEMRAVARALGASQLGGTTREALLQALPRLRESCGDRAILRSLHFFQENERVRRQKVALDEGDFASFLALLHESGLSSWRLLQNCKLPGAIKSQSIPLALAISETFLSEIGGRGACRVHGGGFAGTILMVIPEQEVAHYVERITPVFGKGAAQVLGVREYGTTAVSL